MDPGNLDRERAMAMLADRFVPHYASDLEGVIQFEIGADGALDYHLVVGAGGRSVVPGRHPAPSLRLKMGPADYPEVFTGDLTQLFATGRLAAEGDLRLGVTLAAMLRPQAQADWQPDRSIIERVSASGPPLRAVERRPMPPADEFTRAYARASRPLIVTDAMAGWDALALTPAALAARFGHLRVVPRVGNYVASAFTAQRDYAPMSLAEYLQVMAAPVAGLPPYVGNNPVPDELLASLGTPPFFSATACGRPSMWLGPAGTVTPLHRDLVDNALVQVFGHKRLLLFSPEQSPLLGTWQSTPLLDGTRVDPENPDLEQHPLFTQARAVPCTLAPGEMLFLPAGWFHHVRALSTSLSVNFFSFYEPPAAMSVHQPDGPAGPR